MLKKIIFAFVFSFLTIGFFGTETKGYSLNEALTNSQNIEETGAELVLPEFMPGVHEDTETDPSNFTGLIQNIINGLTGIAGGVAILFIVINAAGLVFAVGNTDSISNSKKGLTWSVIGLVLIIFSYIIAKTVINLTYSGENFAETSTEAPAAEDTTNPCDEAYATCNANATDPFEHVACEDEKAACEGNVTVSPAQQACSNASTTCLNEGKSQVECQTNYWSCYNSI